MRKAPKNIRKKAFICLKYLKDNGPGECPYKVSVLKGKFKKFKYLEAKIGRDYRIIFRVEKKNVFVRWAGTHNALGTG